MPDALTPLDVLSTVNERPRRLQSNFCRDNAVTVGRLASLGLITTRIGSLFGNEWRCTWKGLKVLDAMEESDE
jgi:hypothetical protein